MIRYPPSSLAKGYDPFYSSTSLAKGYDPFYSSTVDE
jgi:hypothetical protein